jgi:hypothetical protein
MAFANVSVMVGPQSEETKKPRACAGGCVDENGASTSRQENRLIFNSSEIQ